MKVHMKHIRLLALALVILTYACKSAKVSPETNTHRWISLFNGRNLDNWIPKISGYPLGENWGNTFDVTDSILRVRYNAYDSFKNRFGALYYNKPLSNYRLRVEYRFVGDTAKGAPSWGYRDGGIQYHCQAPTTIALDQPFPVCLEYNLHGGNGTEERPTGEICTNGMYVEIAGKRNTSYCTLPAVQRTFHGDQWVTAEIEVRNGTITHFANGEKILVFENPRYDSAHAVAKTLMANRDAVVKDGYISLQSNSHPMDFRKIEILEY
jgi:hypothetical protein